MKIINSIIGILIITLGWILMSTTVFNEPFKTIAIKIAGFLVVLLGVVYLNKIAKLGKQ